MYELLHEFSNDLKLRILVNKGSSRKSLKYLDVMVSTQPSTQNLDFDVF